MRLVRSTQSIRSSGGQDADHVPMSRWSKIVRMVRGVPLRRGYVRFLLAAIVVTLLIICLFSFRVIRSMMDDAEQVTESRRVLLTIEDVDSDLQRAESARRGHIITGDSSYQAEYKAARDSVLLALSALSKLTHDEPVQLQHLDTLVYLVRSRLDLLDESLEAPKENPSDPANRVDFTTEGKALRTSISALLDRMYTEEQDQVDTRNEQWHTTSREAIITILSGGLVTVILLSLIFLVLFRHLRHIERTEAALLKRTEELSESNQELESFSYSVSHDLKAPLRAINGFSTLLLDDAASKLSETEREHLMIIAQNAAKMGRLVEELLTFSRLNKSALASTLVDFEPIIQAIIEEEQNAHTEQSVKVQVGKLPLANADPVLIRQVWKNLLSNAFKFSRGRGTHATVEISAYRQDTEVVYVVKDNGVGFDMKYYNKLFGVFERLHTAHEFEGHGIGLAFTKRIIERHGGKVWAEAKVGEGASFSFSLPQSGGGGGREAEEIPSKRRPADLSTIKSEA